MPERILTNTFLSLCSTCPCFLTFHFTLLLSHCSITPLLPSCSACHLPPPDILSEYSLHRFLCLPVTLCPLYLKETVKILRICHEHSLYIHDAFMPPFTWLHISHISEIDACMSLRLHMWQVNVYSRLYMAVVWCNWNALMWAFNSECS